MVGGENPPLLVIGGDALAAGLRFRIAGDLASAVMAAALEFASALVASAVMAAALMAAALALAAAVLAAAAVAASLFAAAANTVEATRSEAFFETFDAEFHGSALSRKTVKVLRKLVENRKRAHVMPITRAAPSSAERLPIRMENLRFTGDAPFTWF